MLPDFFVDFFDDVSAITTQISSLEFVGLSVQLFFSSSKPPVRNRAFASGLFSIIFLTTQ